MEGVSTRHIGLCDISIPSFRHYECTTAICTEDLKLKVLQRFETTGEWRKPGARLTANRSLADVTVDGSTLLPGNTVKKKKGKENTSAGVYTPF